MKGRSRGDPGKIHRSKGFGVQGCRRKYRKGTRREGVGVGSDLRGSVFRGVGGSIGKGTRQGGVGIGSKVWG